MCMASGVGSAWRADVYGSRSQLQPGGIMYMAAGVGYSLKGCHSWPQRLAPEGGSKRYVILCDSFNSF